MNSLDSVAATLHSLGQEGKNAVAISLKFVLLAMNDLDDSQKKEQLQHVVPFIKNWAIVNIGGKFALERETGVPKEYQVCLWFSAYKYNFNLHVVLG